MADNKDPEEVGEDFVNNYLDSMPDVLSVAQVLRIVCGTIAAFSDDEQDASRTVMLCVMELKAFYADQSDMECHCPECVAKRRVH